MIVCSCNALSDHAVREVCSGPMGPRSTGAVYRCLGCSAQCGRCATTIRAIMRDCGASCASDCAECPAQQMAQEFMEAAE